MKRALLLLAMVCLLIAAPLSAAAFEPTNAVALDGTTYAIKTMAKEEVSSAFVAVENVALPAVPIPGSEPESLMNVSGFMAADSRSDRLVEQEVDRVSSRFT